METTHEVVKRQDGFNFGSVFAGTFRECRDFAGSRKDAGRVGGVTTAYVIEPIHRRANDGVEIPVTTTGLY